MHWTLDDVRNLRLDEYEVLIAWLQKQADRAKYGDSIDMDEVNEAERAATAKKALHGRD